MHVGINLVCWRHHSDELYRVVGRCCAYSDCTELPFFLLLAI